MHVREAFSITDIQHYCEPDGLAHATVVFSSSDDSEIGELHNHVQVKLCLVIPESATIEELHESAYRKAIELLHGAISRTEGKTAKQLRNEAAEADRAENARLEMSWQPDSP